MYPHITFKVTPNLPKELEPLRALAYNTWWTWEPTARKLFWFIDPELWKRVNHNPIRMLQLARQNRLEELAEDEKYLQDVKSVMDRLNAYMEREDTYGKKRAGSSPLQRPIAYFSAEFGFHESIPIYSGGLGILSGDHCKAASDLNLNFVAVTLLYRHGYFKQEINRDGWQEAVELDQNFAQLPVTEVLQNGKEVIVSVRLFESEDVFIKLWKMQVGRVWLYLLDTDIPQNSSHNREITAQLYGGDNDMRIRQEIVLGMGGVRALHALDIHPQVYHMNEGHSSFLGLERIRRLMQRSNLDFRSALQVVAASNVFTTHTPVPAGNDVFPRGMIHRYFPHYPQEVGISFDELMSYGTSAEHQHEFSMTILALRTSRHSNGVSALHGEVSRDMWKNVWQNVPTHEVPITSITNGVHTKSWLAPEIETLYRRYLGKDWEDHLTEKEYWDNVTNIPAGELWDTHQMLKRRLIDFVRERVTIQRQRCGESPEQLRRINHLLEPDILTIGFARRFATYKRATLLFSDPERLKKILNNSERPVQFIFAGKAHPADDGGKRFIQEVSEFSRREGFEDRIIFVEDYDACVGRRLYQGVDLWLNNPLRPLEASGTSGMKLPPNGGINLSVLDGWWCEAYNENNGWAIGKEIEEGSLDFQNQVDADSLYRLLESQIVPLFYTKPDGKLPTGWIQLMYESMRTVTPEFNTQRMVMEYNEKLYEHAASSITTLLEDSCKNAVELSEWKANTAEQWHEVRILNAEIVEADSHNVSVGESVKVQAVVQLGSLTPSDVLTQLYYGESEGHDIQKPHIADMSLVSNGEGKAVYEGSIAACESGSFGLSVRVQPYHPNMTQGHELRLITWSL